MKFFPAFAVTRRFRDQYTAATKTGTPAGRRKSTVSISIDVEAPSHPRNKINRDTQNMWRQSQKKSRTPSVSRIDRTNGSARLFRRKRGDDENYYFPRPVANRVSTPVHHIMTKCMRKGDRVNRTIYNVVYCNSFSVTRPSVIPNTRNSRSTRAKEKRFCGKILKWRVAPLRVAENVGFHQGVTIFDTDVILNSREKCVCRVVATTLGGKNRLKSSKT